LLFLSCFYFSLDATPRRDAAATLSRLAFRQYFIADELPFARFSLFTPRHADAARIIFAASRQLRHFADADEHFAVDLLSLSLPPPLPGIYFAELICRQAPLIISSPDAATCCRIFRCLCFLPVFRFSLHFHR